MWYETSKSLQKTISATAHAENVDLLDERTQTNCGGRCLLCSSCPEISVLSQTNGLQLAIWYPLPYIRVSKAANIWPFKQILRLAPPDRISPYQNIHIHCYLTHWESFPTVCHHQTMISIADNWDIKHVTSRVLQYAISLNTILFTVCAFGNHKILCGKGAYSNNTIPNTSFETVILNYWCQTVFLHQSCNTFF